MGALILAAAAGLAAGFSAAAPWFVYASQIVPRLESARARRLAYVVAGMPALATSVMTVARLSGLTTGSTEVDVTLIAAAIGLACSWSPIVRLALAIAGGSREHDGWVEVRAATARMVAYVMAAVLMLQVVTAFAGPAYSAMVICSDAEDVLAELEPGPSASSSLSDSLPWTPPERGALFMVDVPMNLDRAAGSRHDPDTREQLVDAGFVGAHMRAWLAADGRGIQADVFEFRSHEGAVAYQAQVTRHACQYANEAFLAPEGGVGLQVNYDTGDPILEQISWVAGSRRYLVSVSELVPPSDHERVGALRDAVTESWLVTGQGPVTPQPLPSATQVPTPRPVTDPAVIEQGLATVGEAVEATLAEGTVWINKHAVFEGSSVIPDGATAFAGGQMSLQDPTRMRALVQFAEIEDTETNSAEVILDGSRLYLRGRMFDGLVGEGRWLLVDLRSPHPRAEPFKALASGHNDASMALLALYGATEVLGVADDIVNEIAVRRFTLTVRLDAALDMLPDALLAAYRSNLEALENAEVETEYTAEVWVGEDGLIHHVEYMQDLGPTMGGGAMSTTVDFSDFGLPLDLDVPEPELITPVEDAGEPQHPLPRA